MVRDIAGERRLTVRGSEDHVSPDPHFTVIPAQGKAETRQSALQINRLHGFLAVGPRDSDGELALGLSVGRETSRRLALQHEIDLDDIRAAGFACVPMIQIILPADACSFVGRGENLDDGDEAFMTALANLDKLLGVLFVDDGSEERLLNKVMPLADSCPIAIHETGQEGLVKAGDEQVLELRPKFRVFEKRIHSRERAWHGFLPCSLPRLLTKHPFYTLTVGPVARGSSR